MSDEGYKPYKPDVEDRQCPQEAEEITAGGVWIKAISDSNDCQRGAYSAVYAMNSTGKTVTIRYRVYFQHVSRSGHNDHQKTFKWKSIRLGCTGWAPGGGSGHPTTYLYELLEWSETDTASG